MKSINKLFVMLIGIVSFTITSCSDDDFKAGDPTNDLGNNVYFDETDNIIRLSPTELTFTLSVSRTNYDAALTVPLVVTDINKSLFTVPSTVDFAAGEQTKEITIDVSDQLVMFENYNLLIYIDPAYTYPYATTDLYPRVELVVVKEDYKSYATGKYYSTFWGEDDDNPLVTDVTLEYSEINETYRLSNCWGANTGSVIFKWDGTNTVELVNSAISVGLDAGSEGNVTANESEDPCTYDATTKTFTFPFEWTVSAGSYGVYSDTYVIESLIQNN